MKTESNLSLATSIAIAVALVGSIHTIQAQAISTHFGDADPVVEGWTKLGAGSTGPIDDSGTLAWSVSNSSPFLVYQQLPTAEQVTQADTLGWRLTLNLRDANGPVGVDPSTAAAFRYDRGFFQIHFGTEADGDPVVQLVTDIFDETGPIFTLDGAGAGYHQYELVFDPVAASADLFVDGIERLSDYAGAPVEVGLPVGVLWGAFDAISAQGNYNLVQFSIVPEPSSMVFVVTGCFISFLTHRRRKTA